MEPITLMLDDGTELLLYVIEDTELSGNKYYLACEDPEGDSEAYILKEIVDEEDPDSIIMEFVEDDVEFDAVAKLFEELVGEDADFEY